MSKFINKFSNVTIYHQDNSSLYIDLYETWRIHNKQSIIVKGCKEKHLRIVVICRHYISINANCDCFSIAVLKKKLWKCTHMHLFVPIYITLPRGVSIDVACHAAWGPCSWDQSIMWCCCSITFLVSLFLICPPPPHTHHALDKAALSRIGPRYVPKHESLLIWTVI